MRQRLRAVRSDESGFTLTELLIVIVILGVLTGIVVFAVGQFSDRGEESACRTAAKTTEVGIETFRANNGRLPTGQTELVPDYLRTDPGAPDEYDVGINYTTGAVTAWLTPGSATTTNCLD